MTRTVEHTVQTPEFKLEKLSQDAAGVMGRARLQTRADFCVPLSEVLQAVRDRRSLNDIGGANTQRRVPLR